MRLACLLVAASLVGAPGSSSATPVAARATLDERLGARIPTGLEFRAEDGSRVALAELFRDGKPVVLVLSYERCTMLCNLVMRGLSQVARSASLRPGEDYRVLAVSLDPKEQPAQAKTRRERMLQSLALPNTSAAARFLVGEDPAIRALAGSVGFGYFFDSATDQYAHPAALVVLTAEGVVSRYLYGSEYVPRDFELALVEAGRGTVGTIGDRLVLACYRFDPATRRYGPYIQGFMRGGSALILAAIGGLLFMLWRKERARS